MNENENVPFDQMPQLHTGSFLTKEQAEQFRETFKNLTVVVRCKDCRFLIDHYGFMNDGYCANMIDKYGVKFKPDKDWFCADGVAKDINVPDKKGR